MYPALSRLERDGYLRSAWEDEQRAHNEGGPARRYYRVTAPGVNALNQARDYYRKLPACSSRPISPRGREGEPVKTPHSRWTRAAETIVAAAAPLAPSDIRRDWLREWQAELAYDTRRRAGAFLFVRTLGAFVHAAWLRWDRWRLEMLLQDIRYAVRTLTRKPGFAMHHRGDAGARHWRQHGDFQRRSRGPPAAAAVSRIRNSSSTVRHDLAAPNRPGGAASPPDFVDWRRDNRAFTEIAAMNAGSYALIGENAAEQVPGAAGHRRLFQCSRRTSPLRPHAASGGRCARLGGRCGHRTRTVDAAIRRQPGGHWVGSQF